MALRRLLRRGADPVRRGLRSGAARWPWFRRIVEVGARELDRALRDDTYGGSYFGSDRDPSDRMGLSGYERYDRATSNADVAAYIAWRWFPARRALDVGCALGFLVEAERELGIDAEGVDLSKYAIEHAAIGAIGHVRYGNLLHRLPFDDGSFDLVTALETLEHLQPTAVPKALRELRRISRGWLIATIPSFGPNEHGPGGWLNTKVDDGRLEHYLALGDDFDGPVRFDDLARDAAGEPSEGHLTIASFRWWTERFAEAGFERCGEMERRIHPHLARFGLTKFWNLYVFCAPGTPVPHFELRPHEEAVALEKRWRLDMRASDPEDLRRVNEALGVAQAALAHEDHPRTP